MWAGGWFAALLVVPALAAQVDSELQRVRDLVRAGALPRNALAEAENEHLERRYLETLQRTLLSEDLEPSEVQAMLGAAKGLVKIAQDRFDVVMARVTAGATPARKLQEAKDALATAKRQAELAESRADLISQMTRMAGAEGYLEELESEEMAYRFHGFDEYELEVLFEIGGMYAQMFGSEVPISAEGDTALHRSLGLDHTGRIDVDLHPDSEEGQFLIYLLESLGIPYIAFLSAIPGQSTGPHIHVGPPSERIEDLEAGPGDY